MVFGRAADAFSFASNRWLGSQSSTSGYESTSQSESSHTAMEVGPHAIAIPASPHKNNIRLSSSLQDFSAYHRLDPEEGNPNVENTTPHFQPRHSLQLENSGSSFSKDKALPGRRVSQLLRTKKWMRALLICLCIIASAFLIYTFSRSVYSHWSEGRSKFYVVLDCGSTGTRVFIYQAFINDDRNNALPVIVKPFTGHRQKKFNLQNGRAYDRMENEPGLDKLVHNASGLKAALRPLLGWAEKQIPKSAHQSTSLYLFATAGVRRLPAADSKWLLDKAWSIMKNSPFLCHQEWVHTISGTEEAYYGWIALNHRAGVLGDTLRRPTYGALDLGGSSLQITFESKEQDNSTLNVRIGPVSHYLGAYSLSGYGLNDAFGKSVVYLLKKIPKISKADLINGRLELKHPCLQFGFKERYVCSRCRSSPIANKSWGKSGSSDISIQLIGAPNWDECAALAKVVVNSSNWSNTTSALDCEVQPCAIPDGFYRPYGQFYAISGFFVVYRFFNLTSDAALDDVLDKGREFCEKSWEVAKHSVVLQPFIEQYCFRAPYIVSLLREGLHITDKQLVIGSGSITWTLGVALLEAGKEYSTKPGFHGYTVLQMKINPMAFVAILLISSVLLLFALSRVHKWIRMPRFFRRPYSHLFRQNSVSSSSVLGVPSPFQLQRWSPISSGDGRVKMPLSPTIGGAQERPFGFGHGWFSSGSSGAPTMATSGNVGHSYSLNNLGLMQFESNMMGSFWSPHRGQTRLQSRRSQSREDLSSSLAETHLVKV